MPLILTTKVTQVSLIFVPPQSILHKSNLRIFKNVNLILSLSCSHHPKCFPLQVRTRPKVLFCKLGSTEPNLKVFLPDFFHDCPFFLPHILSIPQRHHKDCVLCSWISLSPDCKQLDFAYRASSHPFYFSSVVTSTKKLSLIKLLEQAPTPQSLFVPGLTLRPSRMYHNLKLHYLFVCVFIVLPRL